MRRLSVLLLSCFTCIQAQDAATAVKAGPPACPAMRKAAAHPSPAELLHAQQAAADDPSVLLSAEPVGNMGLLRYQVRDYADCTGDNGCYWADLEAQALRAQAALEEAVRQAPRGSKLAMVLDIDETSLSSYCEEVREDFGYIPDRFEAWITSTEASIPIAGTVKLVKRAQELHVDIFFITGRPETQRAATEQNLHKAGYSQWRHLSLRDAVHAHTPTAEYKAAERRKIVEAGYLMILNMGDQWSDLEGAPMAQRSVKLPNPFYYLP